jgi:hypothetical protein
MSKIPLLFLKLTSSLSDQNNSQSSFVFLKTANRHSAWRCKGDIYPKFFDMLPLQRVSFS